MCAVRKRIILHVLQGNGGCESLDIYATLGIRYGMMGKYGRHGAKGMSICVDIMKSAQMWFYTTYYEKPSNNSVQFT